MLYLNESRLITLSDAEPGELVLRWREAGQAIRCLVILLDNGQRGLFRLDRCTIEFGSTHLPTNLLSLGRPIVQFDENSAVAEGEFYPRNSLVIQETGAGIFEPGRRFGGQGRLVSFEGTYTDFQQGVRDLAFSHYRVGVMRNDVFVDLQSITAEVSSD